MVKITETNINDKYLLAHVLLSNNFLLSSNGYVNINKIAEKMDGNILQNKKIIKRVLSVIHKNTLFSNKVYLTYSDYLTLQKIVKDDRTYKMNFIAFVISLSSLAISMISLLIVTGQISVIIAIFALILFFAACYYILKMMK